ncbi:MAG: type II toxin-antitoxin system RelE/ParE family toxin [Prevotella sp.]|nr:type II toxin-antitoxin system RelE/ParE family toxin [Prevotella sp.]
MRNVTWSESAYASFSDVIAYTVEEYGLKQAQILRNLVAAVIERVRQFPYSSPVDDSLPFVGVELRSTLIISKLKLVYYISDDGGVKIVFIWNVQRSANTILRQLDIE